MLFAMIAEAAFVHTTLLLAEIDSATKSRKH